MPDLMGQAIWDFYHQKAQAPLIVQYPDGSADDMPVQLYLRDATRMPELEIRALNECRGRVLEIGAGAGSHALILQERGFHVTALDISEKAVAVMRDRGVQQTICADIFAFEPFTTYDTLLMLMNGIGLCGSIEGLHRFFRKAHQLLAPGGHMLFDSSNVDYLYDGHVPPGLDHYYGEIGCRYAYKRRTTDWFYWLYVDQQKLAEVAAAEGWHTEILFTDPHNQYLARLSRKTGA